MEIISLGYTNSPGTPSPLRIGYEPRQVLQHRSNNAGESLWSEFGYWVWAVTLPRITFLCGSVIDIMNGGSSLDPKERAISFINLL